MAFTFIQPLLISPSPSPTPSPSPSPAPSLSSVHSVTDALPACSLLLQPPHLLRHDVRPLVAVVVLDLDLAAEEADDHAGKVVFLGWPENRDALAEGEGRLRGRRRAAVVASKQRFVPLEVAVLLKLVEALVTVEPLHVDAVDVRFVLLEGAVLLALVFALIVFTLEPLHVGAVDVRFVLLEAGVPLALVFTFVKVTL